MILETKSLPPALGALLKSLGYHRAGIKLDAAETAVLNDYGSTGRRAFVAVVNLATGESKVTRGSWGGPNPFNPRNAVDLDDRPQAIPPNCVVVQGSEGGTSGVYARLIALPSTIAPLLPSGGPAVSERQARVLAIHRGIKAGPYRQEELRRAGVTQEELDALVAGGFLKRNAAGAVSITTEGKRACEDVRVY